MRFLVRRKVEEPVEGALRYRIQFVWYPVRTRAVIGPEIFWPSEIIWLEKVMRVDVFDQGEWEEAYWYPINKFTMSLYEHNNQ